MSGCLFCKIVNGEVKSKVVFENNEALAFLDINPKAPTHVIIIPRKHIERVADINEEDSGLVGRLFIVARDLARKMKIESGGYRLVVNCNRDAGQEVFHLHLHLLGGRKFAWPPG